MKRYLKYIPVVLLAFLYIVHGWQAVIMTDEFIQIGMQSGLSLPLVKIGLVLVGILDIVLAILLFIKPRKLLLVWMALWPLVPAILGYMGNGEFEMEFIITSFFATLIYFLFLRKKVK